MPSGATRYGAPSSDDQRVAHDRMLLGGLHQRVGDEVGERDLPGFAGRLERLVEPRAASASSTPTGSTRNVVAVGTRQALVHVGDELGGGALDGGGTRWQGRWRRRAPRAWPPRRRPRGYGGRTGRGARPFRCRRAARRRRHSRTAGATPARRRRDRGETPRTWPGRTRRWPFRIRSDPRRPPSRQVCTASRDPGAAGPLEWDTRKITGRHRQGSTTDEGVHAGRSPSSPLVADHRAACRSPGGACQGSGTPDQEPREPALRISRRHIWSGSGIHPAHPRGHGMRRHWQRKATAIGVIAAVVAAGACGDDNAQPAQSPLVIDQGADQERGSADRPARRGAARRPARGGHPRRRTGRRHPGQLGDGNRQPSPPSQGQTATDGITNGIWTLGDALGAQTATAAVTGATNSPITFTATATDETPRRRDHDPSVGGRDDRPQPVRARGHHRGRRHAP